MVFEMLEKKIKDHKRLQALHDTNLLDSTPEESFDRLTRLAARILHAPVSLVTLVDANRQYFKSYVGLSDPWNITRETPLSRSICKHVVATSEPLIVEDARKDPILKDNEAVLDNSVVAYLGVPLRSLTGEDLGSFCVLDNKVRTWKPDEVDLIAELGAAAMREIALRDAMREAEALKQKAHRLVIGANGVLDFVSNALRNGTSPTEVIQYIEDRKLELNAADPK